MVDPSLCPITDPDLWGTRLSQWLSRLTLDPRLVLPMIVVPMAIAWFWLSKRWKRGVLGLGAILLAGYLFFDSPLATRVGLASLGALIPDDPGQPADAIVILGRGGPFRPSRVEVALDLWQAQRAPLIFISGRGDAIEMGDMLIDGGVPSAAIQGEPCSGTTEENAQFTATYLQPQGVRRIILVTDLPHLPRSTLTFRSLGFEVIPRASALPISLSERQQKILTIREWAGLVGYGVTGRYFPQDISARTSPSPLPLPRPVRHAHG
jgi:uncharacterized SAM-binding protein YcdF (DUF218 family)